jgi:hypothetical protein
LDNTAWVDTEKLVQNLVAIQENSVVIYVDVLCRKVGTLGIEHSAATSGAGFLAPDLQVPPRWKCACGLDTSRLRLASKTECNSHQRWDRLNSWDRRSQRRRGRQVLDRRGYRWGHRYRTRWHRYLARWRWGESLGRTGSTFLSLAAEPFLMSSLVGPCYTAS